MEQNEMDDDVVMESLQRCMEELKKAKLDYPGPPPPDELPKTPFGTFTEPTFEQKVCLDLYIHPLMHPEMCMAYLQLFCF